MLLTHLDPVTWIQLHYSACQTPAQSQFQALVVTVVWRCFVRKFGYSTFGQAGPSINLHFPPGCYIAWGKRPTLIIFFTAQLAFIKFVADLTAVHSFLILMMPFMSWWQTVHHPPNYVHKFIPIALIAILHYLTRHKIEPLNTPTHTHVQNQTQKPQTWSLLIQQTFLDPAQARGKDHIVIFGLQGATVSRNFDPRILCAASEHYVDELQCIRWIASGANRWTAMHQLWLQ